MHLPSFRSQAATTSEKAIVFTFSYRKANVVANTLRMIYFFFYNLLILCFLGISSTNLFAINLNSKPYAFDTITLIQP